MAQRSEYYGSRGADIVEWQQKLNRMGAGLKVDGIWGQKTEAAYHQYIDALEGQQNANMPEYALQYKTFDDVSDEELLKQAKAQTQAKYENELESARSASRAEKDALAKTLERLDRDYAYQTDELKRAYEKRRRELSSYALKRGMGRSTYAMDMQNDAYREEQQAMDTALDEKQMRAGDVEDRIAAVETALLEAERYLNEKQKQVVKTLLTELKQAREKERQEILEYNNSLYMKNRDYALKKRDADLDYEIQLAKLSGGSGGSKGSGKSGNAGELDSYYESGYSKTENKLLNEWYSLSDSGKLRYFRDNRDAIKNTSNDLYTRFARDVAEIATYPGRTTTAAVNRNYNYYKDQQKESSYRTGR